MKSERIMPSPGRVRVARSPTVPLGGGDLVIAELMGGSATANGPEKREMISLCDVPHRFAITATFVPIKTSTVGD